MPLIDPSLGTNPSTYSALLTTTLENFQKRLVDNFSDATPLLWWLSQNGRKRHVVGGQAIDIPLMYAGSTVQPFSGYDDLQTEPTEGIAPATFLYKKYQTPVVISRDSETDNMGESRVISLLEAKVKQAEISFKEQMNSDLINNGYAGTYTPVTAGTVNGATTLGTATPDSLRVTGLFDICQNDSQGRAYGGISGSTYSWWANEYADVISAGDIATGFATNGITKMRSTYLDCSRGQDTPDLILCSQESYESYDATLVDQKRYVNTMAADAGFESLMYRATTILFDRDVPTGVMFFLNSNYIELDVHPDVDMATIPFREAERQWARFSRIMWKGELTCSNRARQGLLVNAVN
jgi:hypothetical protein